MKSKTKMDAWREGRDAGWRLALAILHESVDLEHARTRLANLIDYDDDDTDD